MTDLFKKLNVLLRSGIKGKASDTSGTSRRSLPVTKLGKDVDREISELRARVNDALAYEDQLKARVSALIAEVEQFDREADSAVERGEDAIARHVIEKRVRAAQSLSMAEGDLRAHRAVVQELIMRVNQLESAVADARRAMGADSDESDADGWQLTDVLREIREKVVQMSELNTAKAEVQDTLESDSDSVADAIRKSQVEDDLAARRARLSK